MQRDRQSPEPATGPPERAGDLPDGVDEADVQEQEYPVGDPAEPETPRVSEQDGAEADVLEQAMPVPLDEEDERR